MVKTYVILSGGPTSRFIFADLENDDRVEVISQPYQDFTGVKKLLAHFHLSEKINAILPLSLKRVWYPFSKLSQQTFDPEQTYHLIFVNTSLYQFDLKTLKRLKGSYDIHLWLYMLDPMSARSGKIVKPYLDQDLFEEIFSFDLDDCEKYGFSYYPQPFSQFDVPVEAERASDIYFLGRPKGRLEILAKWIEATKTIKQKFILVPDPRNLKEAEAVRELTKQTDPIDAQENIQNIVATKCILELVQKGQGGNTLRYQEAVVYNKKLITNFPGIVELDYYRPDYMKLVEDPSQIDLEWIQEDLRVDYSYDGRFSASRLIDRILNR